MIAVLHDRLDTFSRGLGCSNYLILIDIKNLLIRYRIPSNDIPAGQLIVTNCFVALRNYRLRRSRFILL